MATILLVGTIVVSISVEDVFAPPPARPEKIVVGPIKPNTDSQQFEIGILVFLPKGSESASFNVETTLRIVNPDGRTIQEGSDSDRVPEGVGEGGNNSSVHKLTAEIPYVPEDLEGERVRLEVTAKLMDGSTVVVQDSTFKWACLCGNY